MNRYHVSSILFSIRNCKENRASVDSKVQLGMYLYFNSPSTCWIFMVEGLVDDAHHRLTCAPQINPNEDQRTVKT